MKNSYRAVALSIAALSLAGYAALSLAGVKSSTPIQTVLHTFVGGTDGSNPVAGLIVDQQGALYGTTPNGGAVGGVCADGCGTVFKLTPPAPGQTAWTQTVLYTFCPEPNCSDGIAPNAGLIADQQGALYGTTQFGGTHDNGTVFKLTPPAPGQSEWPQAVLYAFCAESNCSDGFNPKAGLIADQQGALYGTTFNGGAGFNQPQAGTVFKLTPPAEGQERWTQTVLHDFCSQLNGPYCSDGAQPAAGLAADQPGVLYGTTQYGGVSDGGTVFRVVF